MVNIELCHYLMSEINHGESYSCKCKDYILHVKRKIFFFFFCEKKHNFAVLK